MNTLTRPKTDGPEPTPEDSGIKFQPFRFIGDGYLLANCAGGGEGYGVTLLGSRLGYYLVVMCYQVISGQQGDILDISKRAEVPRMESRSVEVLLVERAVCISMSHNGLQSRQG
ncbi:MAG: hypothetical protein A2284_01680 [Deltaproteobacteria bacterium RIFOXYA12_FULL_61_11]|nr:MAG: hypothetical protein A2284_01680 [Deltaproteobacteria bacterium RIFOXYA12_FULL_61_11]